MRKSLWSMVGWFAAVAVVACSSDAVSGVKGADSVAIIAVSLGSTTLRVGQTTHASALLKNADGVPLTGKPLTWSTSNIAVASVDPSSGDVTATGGGSATITAAGTGFAGSAIVTVLSDTVASVSVTVASPDLLEGDATQAVAAIKDDAGNLLQGPMITFTSDDSTIAKVDSLSGQVTAITEGSASIWAASENIRGHAPIFVHRAPVATVIVSVVGSVAVGATTQASAIEKDSRGNALSRRVVAWTTSNPQVVAIDGNTGVVTGMSVGSGTITATSEGMTGTATVTVTSAGGTTPAAVATVTVSLGASSVVAGGSTQATAVAKDAGGNILTGRTVIWSTSSSAVATVNGTTGAVTAVAQGAANIIATSEGMSGSAALTVTAVPVVPVATVTVSLGASSVVAGGTTQATAVEKDANGNVLTGRSVVWSTSNASAATVNSATGVVTAVAAGSANIIATSGGKSGSAAVTVTAAAPPPPAPVATVAVSLGASSVVASGTTQATAVEKDASGNVLTGRSVAWSSSNTSAATVSATTGLVTAVAAGTASITATSEGKTGSATVTVTAASPPPSGDLGCANPQAGYIWCDDFETDHSAKYFEDVASNGAFVRQAGTGFNGSTSMHVHWNAGQVDAGSLKLAFGKTPDPYFRAVDAGTANYREIYWRFYFMNSSGWTPNGNDKMTRAVVFAGSNWQEAAVGHMWGGPDASTQNFIILDPASGTDPSGNLVTTEYNDFNNLTWLGQSAGTTSLMDAAHSGVWNCVEVHMKLNDAGSSNGIFEYSVNGVSQARHTGMNWLGSYNAFGINAVFLENYINNGAPNAQDRYYDNFVVSTQPIGCNP